MLYEAGYWCLLTLSADELLVGLLAVSASMKLHHICFRLHVCVHCDNQRVETLTFIMQNYFLRFLSIVQS